MRDYAKYAGKLVDLVYPRRCPVCDEPVPVEDELICGDCVKKIRYIAGARCRKCSKGLTDDTKIYTTAATPQPNGIIVAKGMGQVENREKKVEGSAWLARVGAPARQNRRACIEERMNHEIHEIHERRNNRTTNGHEWTRISFFKGGGRRR